MKLEKEMSSHDLGERCYCEGGIRRKMEIETLVQWKKGCTKVKYLKQTMES